MSGLSISRAWDETKAMLSRDARLFVAVALALLVLPQAALGAFSPMTPADLTPIFFALLTVALLTGCIAQIALNRLAMPPASTVGASIARGVQRLFPLLIAILLAVMAIALLAFIVSFIGLAAGALDPPVPGAAPSPALAALFVASLIAIFSVFQLVIPISAAEAGGPIRLLSRAWALGKPHYWRLAAFLVLVIGGMLLLWISAQLIVGLIVTAIFGPPEQGSVGAVLLALLVALVQAGWTIVTSVMLARIYVQIAGDRAAEASVPTSGS